MRGAIGVRINDGVKDRTVTARVTDLRFSTVSDGGHKAASFTITVPRGTFTDLGAADKCYLYDTRSGMPLWEGYTEAPTPITGPGGDTYAISALGGMIRAADETRGLVYVDRSLGQYEKDTQATESSSFETGASVTFPAFQRVRTQLTPGQVVATGQFAGAANNEMDRAGQGLGAFYAVIVSGKTDAGYRTSLAHPTGVVDLIAGGINTGAISATVWVGTDFPSGTTLRVAIRLRRTGGATNIADDNTWSDFVDATVLGQRMTRAGTLITGAAGLVSATTVRADQVVEDLLGRLLGFCDKTASTVTVTSRAIDQLAYPDGATAQRVMDDLADYEPNMLWEILHSTPAGHIFNYRAWPTDVRYEISTRDGYTESGADVDLCNRVVVTWTDAAGTTQNTPVTATSAQYPALKALEDAGRVRDADPISLPDGLGSLANAQAIGAAILADAAGQNTSARAVVRRPLRDLYTGAMVMPWEIQAGYLVQVRELDKVLRLTAQEYTDADCSTALTLGYPSLTREQRVAALART